jgi:dCMP deaminase
LPFSNQTEADRFFMSQAHGERAKSDDPKAKLVPQSGVGAIIVKDGEQIGRSANVLPPRLASAFKEKGALVENADRYFVIEHAERGAIYDALLAGHNTMGGTMYCTRFPCSDCARAIIWAGIRRAVFPGGFAGENRWLDGQRAALRMLREAGVTVRYLSPT